MNYSLSADRHYSYENGHGDYKFQPFRTFAVLGIFGLVLGSLFASPMFMHVTATLLKRSLHIKE